MKVLAAIQEEKSGRVYQLLAQRGNIYWLRASPGHEMEGPFVNYEDLFDDMAEKEGKSSAHWQRVFDHFYPTMPFSANRVRSYGTITA